MMNTANYTRVGFFVLLLGGLAFFMGLWLWSKHGQGNYNIYVTYLNETVTGLNEDSVVRFNGVPVGYIQRIRLNSKNTQEVKVWMKIKDNIPITTATHAVLMAQGITGLKYVELKTEKPIAPVLVALKGHRYPVIDSDPSFIVEFSEVARKLSNNVDVLTDTLNKASIQAQKTFEQTDLTMQTVSQQALPIFLQSMNNFNDVMVSLKLFSDEIRQNPSMLIRGKPVEPLTAGEKSS
jgi:phospholipid/cholesterol/gamma-HCH transport system substrate-binding protein